LRDGALVQASSLRQDPHLLAHALKHCEGLLQLLFGVGGGHDGAHPCFAFGDGGEGDAGAEDAFLKSSRDKSCCPAQSDVFLQLDDVHMCAHRNFACSEAVTGQMAAAQGAFAHASRTLHLPHARLDANAGHVMFALLAVDVVYVLF
jgi:hypothetical protein